MAFIKFIQKNTFTSTFRCELCIEPQAFNMNNIHVAVKTDLASNVRVCEIAIDGDSFFYECD